MKSLPVRRQQFKTADFAAWLARYGAEVGVPTNAYEVIRYRAWHGESKRAETHIVYAKESGLLTFTGASKAHYTQFLTGAQLYPQPTDGGPPKGWTKPAPRPKKEGPTPGAKVRAKLLERDGDECWFCGLPMGDDQTIEHLVAKSDGGFNRLANMALAHAACNHEAGNLPLVQKIAMRARLRGVDA